MQRLHLPASTLLLLLGALPLACGGGGGGGDGSGGGGDGSGDGGGTNGGAAFTSGAEPTKDLDEVTPAEADASCQKLADEMDRVFAPEVLGHVACTLAALQYTDTESECEDLVRECKDTITEEQLAEARSSAPTVECDGEPGPITYCPVTVAQYDRCVNDTLDELRRQFASVTCQPASEVSDQEQAAATISEYREPASCKELQEICPGDDEGYLLGGRFNDDGSGPDEEL